jgi:hypothetical protein
MQANIKKITQLSIKPSMNNIVVGLHCLWHKVTKMEFDIYFNKFIDEWERKAF